MEGAAGRRVTRQRINAATQNKNMSTRGRRSKTQIEADKLSAEKTAKALSSLSENLARLFKKHMGQLVGGAEFHVAGKITSDGMASIRLSYTATVTDSHGFALDDGQRELIPPSGGEESKAEPQPPGVGEEA